VKLKVLSFNICHGHGIDGRQDLKRTIEAIRQIDADIVGLQEVDRFFGERSGWEDQPEQLAQSLGMHVVFGPNLDRGPHPEHPDRRKQYGTAILSKHPILASRNHMLPQVHVPDGYNEPRGVLEAHIQTDGAVIRFFNTHLGLKAKERMLQAKRLLELARPEEGNCIVTGDFNALPGSPELDILKTKLCDTYAEFHGGQHEPTFLSTAGSRAPEAVKCIDYIFCSRSFRTVGAAVLFTLASDHLPLVAELALEKS